jgi:type IV fimbrial biogenesis protein FimT
MYYIQNRDRSQGFTLIELMIVVAIVAILLSIVVPGFRTMFANNNAATLSEDFASAISYARVEAVKRGKAVSLCRSNTAGTDCDDSGNDWNVGYLIYLEGKTSETDTATSVPTDGVLKVYPSSLESKSSIEVVRDSNPVKFLRFTSLGTLARNVDKEAVITTTVANCKGNQTREITLKLSGSVSVAKKTCT